MRWKSDQDITPTFPSNLEKIFHMASPSPFYLDHWTIFQLWLFYIMHYSDPEKMNISLLATNHQVCELFYELLKCNILSSLEQEEEKYVKSFRAASCKKSMRKNNSIRKNNLTRKHILYLKLCFLVELFFLIDFYMKWPQVEKVTNYFHHGWWHFVET